MQRWSEVILASIAYRRAMASIGTSMDHDESGRNLEGSGSLGFRGVAYSGLGLIGAISPHAPALEA